jgi:phosphate transport system substrate-binding protein
MKHFLLAFLNIMLISACQNSGSRTQTTRIGKQICYADESFKPLLETASYTFSGVYPEAQLVFQYTSETKAMNAFSTGKVRTIFVSRDFTDKEKKALKTHQIEMTSTLLARDAVVFIVNNQNNDTVFTQDQILNLLKNQKATWPASNKEIEVVFDRVQSANFNSLLTKFGIANYAKHVHAAKSTEEMINYIQQYPNAIGVLGYNFISDLDDKVVLSRLKKFRVVGIGDENGKYWRADRATIIDKKYPFIREIWGITSSSPNRISSGFINFLNSQQGQLLMEKCELGPGRGASRAIQLLEE